jgi:hypothetical protein
MIWSAVVKPLKVASIGENRSGVVDSTR